MKQTINELFKEIKWEAQNVKNSYLIDLVNKLEKEYAHELSKLNDQVVGLSDIVKNNLKSRLIK